MNGQLGNRRLKMEVNLSIEEWIDLLEPILEIENTFSDTWQLFLNQLLTRELRDYLLEAESNNQFESDLLEIINVWLETGNRDNHEFTTVEIENEVEYF